MCDHRQIVAESRHVTAASNEPPDNPALADGYGQAAPMYWAAGWRGILPMPRGRKFPPPTDYTGYAALTPSYPDITAWCEDRPDGNIALHLPDGVIGIDVDAYEGRTGAGTLAYAEHLWGALPPTVRTTSRDDLYSGIRLYRVPAGTRLATKIDFPDVGLGHVEIIQASHRYAVVWPSLHPSGARYRWQDADGYAADIPDPASLPELPETWVASLAPGSQVDGLDTVDVAHEIAGLSAGAMDIEVSTRLQRAVLDLPGAASRHDTTCAHVLALLRLSEQSHSGVQQAIEALGSAFIEAVTADGSRTEQQARSEYARMIVNQRGHALIKATPTVLDTAEVVRANATERGGGKDARPEPALGGAEVIDIPDDEFWASRAFLARIRDQSYARLASPWSVLGVAICRALAHVPPWITLPPVIGGRGSLNTFVALVGRSGTGKGISEAVAAELVPFDDLDNIAVAPVGSGEGLAHSYVVRRGKDLERVRQSCLFSVPEVDTLTSIGGRQGATIMSKLRSAYSGEEIGFSYADPAKRLLVGAHNYRLAMVVGVQPERAGPLFADSAGGTPQRFVWLPANDPAIGSTPGAEGGPIEVTSLADWGSYPCHVDIPDIARDTIRNAHIARARGEGNALDGHALQTREKVMVALCALDGRTIPDEWDWYLAGAVMAVSDRTRGDIERAAAEATRREAIVRGRAMGIAQVERDDAAATHRVRRVAEAIIRALARYGPSLAVRECLPRVAYRDRPAFAEAVELLIEQGRITFDDVVTDGDNGRRIALAEDPR